MSIESSDTTSQPAPVALPVSAAHGQAALLLVESLIHGLIARSSLTVADGVAIVETAMEIDTKITGAGIQPGPVPDASQALLTTIGISLRRDLNEPDPAE